MTAGDRVALLAAYVPSFVRQSLLLDGGAPTAPREERRPAAVLFADISGFTGLSQQLAERKRSGPEELRNILNRCFGQLVGLVHLHGGEVAHFAGDAIIALWLATDEDLPGRLRDAAACALAARSALDDVPVTNDFRLRLRLALSAGEAWMATVGGIEGRWRFLAGGPPLRQMASAAAVARAGEILVSPEAWALLGGLARGQERPSGHHRLTSLDAPGHPQPGQEPRLPDEVEPALVAFLPRIVRAQIEAGLTDWVGEYRRVTTLFVNVPEVDDGTSDALARLQRITTAFQRGVYHYDGSVNQLLMDDKGTTLIAAWGGSLQAHEDDATRAVQAALAVRRELASNGETCSMGLSTGRIFVGARGSPARLDHGLIGESVNLAARLMEAAAGGIVCDEETRNAAARDVSFEDLPPLALRGLARPIAASRPLGDRRRGGPSALAVVGRQAERERLAAALEALAGQGQGGLVMLEGQPGIGKSALVWELLALAQARGVGGLVGAGDAVERASPYHAWRSILSGLLGGEAVPAELRARAALFNPLFSLDLPGGEPLAQMSAAGRADATRQLAVELIAQAARRAPLLLVIEDAHWLDSASWALVEAVRSTVGGLLMVLTIRTTGSDEVSPEQRRLRADPDAQRLCLEALDPDEAVAVACACLQARSIPGELAALIHARAEGLPLFIEELVSALRDRGLISTHDGHCALASAGALDTVGVPSTVQGIVTSRIDRLTTAEQLTLKVASVLGRTFSLEGLEALHPLRPSRPELEEQLETMTRLELVRRSSARERPGYDFHHAIIEQVAYELLPLARRRELHEAAALWWEGREASLSRPSFAVLAHHWTRAEVLPRALDALEKAGEQALRSGFFHEATVFFGQAVALGAAQPRGRVPGEEDRRLVRWERQLSRAYFGLGREAECRGYAEASVARLGEPVARSRAALAWKLVTEVARQAWHTLLPAPLLRWRTALDPHVQSATRAFHALSYAYYLDQEGERLLHAILRTANLAERLAPSGELARAYGALGYVAGAYGFAGLAQRYLRHALGIADQLQRPLVRADVLFLSGLYRVTNGEWEKVRADMNEARAIFDGLDERRNVLDVRLLENYVTYNSGRLAEAARAYVDLRAAAVRTGAYRNEYLAAVWEAGTALRRGRLDECLAAVDSAERLPRERGAQLALLGFQAVAHLRQGRAGAALRAADEGSALIASRLYTAPYSFEGYRDVAEVYLSLCEGEDVDTRSSLWPKASAACRALRQFARGCRVAQPAAHIQQGRLDWLAGRHTTALRRWQKALAAAVELRLPFEEAVARRQLGRHLPPSPVRQQHLTCAREIFVRLDAALELSRESP